MNGNGKRASYDAIYFNSSGVEHISNEIKNHRNQKYNKKRLKNTSIRFDNVWILFYWIY